MEEGGEEAEEDPLSHLDVEWLRSSTILRKSFLSQRLARLSSTAQGTCHTVPTCHAIDQTLCPLGVQFTTLL